MNKDTSYARIKYKYHLKSFQVTVINQEDKDDDAYPAEKSTQYALISTSFKNEKMVAKMKAFDLLEGVMVTVLVDPYEYIPADWWYFDTRYNILHNT